MENAVKALLMAAGVLIGVLILSMAVALYSSLSNYAEEIKANIEQNELNKFNAQFTGYIRENLTIQDIVTVANIAYENNLIYDLEQDSAGENSYYVQVWIHDDNGERRIEEDIHADTNTLLESNLGNTFECTNDDIQFSQMTGRVISIRFQKK